MLASLNSVVLRRGNKAVLDNASITLYPNEKIGIIGRNGAGKSSLFALITGRLHEDAGNFTINEQCRLAEVAQEMPEEQIPAVDFVIAGDLALVEAEQQLKTAELNGIGEEIANAHLKLIELDYHTAKSRAEILLAGLGFTSQQWQENVNTFSGGWRMRLQLARALMAPSDLLLLDEPTNHLDLDAMVWLESWLIKYTGTFCLISHDREFLDRVTTSIVHLEVGRLKKYSGNYSQFERQRAEQQSQQQAALVKQQAQVEHLQQFINRFRAQATKAKQAQSRIKTLNRLQLVLPMLSEADFTFDFFPPQNLPNPMLILDDAYCGYINPSEENSSPQNNNLLTASKVIISKINRTILPGQRIGILGANGQGKSTLIKTLVGSIPCLSGEINYSKGLKIGYFAQQELDLLRLEENPFQHMLRLVKESSADQSAKIREQDLRNYLGSFNFSGEMMGQTVQSFSGGERARLVLAMLVWQKPNLLVLDEPTNHLDLITREALNVALNQFAGSVLLVSHDRNLLRNVCDEFWLVADEKVVDFTGDIDDYQQYLLQEAKQRREQMRQNYQASKNKLEIQDKSIKTPNKNVKREFEKIEKKLQQLNHEKLKLEQILSTSKDLAQISEMGTKITNLNNEIVELEEQWLNLSE